MPTIPVSDAGWRIEPPVSVPSAKNPWPAATAASRSARRAARDGRSRPTGCAPDRRRCSPCSRSHRELVEVRLAEQDRAGIAQALLRGRRRVRRPIALQDAAGRGRRQRAGQRRPVVVDGTRHEDVLQGIRDRPAGADAPRPRARVRHRPRRRRRERLSRRGRGTCSAWRHRVRSAPGTPPSGRARSSTRRGVRRRRR